MRYLKILLISLMILDFCFAVVVVNSLDGQDVLSAVYYAAVTNDNIGIAYPNYGLSNVYSAAGSSDVFLVQSSSKPVVADLTELLRQRGNRVEVLNSEDPYKTNLDLARKSNVENFVLIDPVYGYNAVSALAYAKLNKMYLLFADKSNSRQVADFLQSKKPQSILIYGNVDSEVKRDLSDGGLRYSEINNGDKFEDNMDLLDRYFSQKSDKKQLILCDGSAIEDMIATGDDPILFIGMIIPPDVYNYLKQKVENGQITVGLVVDMEYLQTAYNLKERINQELGSKKLSMLVKIGQSSGSKGGMPTGVPFMAVNSPTAGLAIEKIEYNLDKKSFEVTYVNTGNAVEYVKSSLVVFVDGDYAGTTGDTQPFALPKGSKTGKEYKMNVGEGELTVNITSFYGISQKNQDLGIVQMFSVGRITYVDESVVDIGDIRLDSGTNELFVTMLNNGSVSAYVQPAVSLVGETTINVDGDKIRLEPKEGKTIRFLLPSVAGVEKMVVKANYGAREGFLEKYVEKEYVPPSFTLDMNYVYIAAIALLIIVVGYLLLERRKGDGKPGKAAAKEPKPDTEKPA